MHYLYRKTTNDYRFSLPQLAQVLELPCPNGPAQYRALSAKAQEMGATYIGRARTNLPSGGHVVKDNVYSVRADHWQTWLTYMRAPSPSPSPSPSPAPSPAPHLAVSGTKEQLQAVQAVCQALGATCVLKG